VLVRGLILSDVIHEAVYLVDTVAGSIPDETGFFLIDLILPAALGPEVGLASNRNEYQESS
jgi:hypothetical protein